MRMRLPTIVLLMKMDPADVQSFSIYKFVILPGFLNKTSFASEFLLVSFEFFKNLVFFLKFFIFTTGIFPMAVKFTQFKLLAVSGIAAPVKMECLKMT